MLEIWLPIGILVALVVVFTIVIVVGTWKGASTDEAAQGEKKIGTKTKIAMLIQALYHTRSPM